MTVVESIQRFLNYDLKNVRPQQSLNLKRKICLKLRHVLSKITNNDKVK